jgi:hypothetical protein
LPFQKGGEEKRTMRRTTTLLLLVVWNVCAACAPSGGQTGGLRPVCAEVDVRPLAPEEPSPTGESASDVLARFAGEISAPLFWQSGVRTTVSLTVRPATDGAVRFVSTGPDAECASFLEIEAELSLRSGDGTVAAVVRGVVVTAEGVEIGIQASGLDAGPILGRPDLVDLPPAPFAPADLAVNLELSMGRLTGELSARGETCTDEAIGGGPIDVEGCVTLSVLVAQIGESRG